MIFDKQNLLSNDQAITGTAVSENVIDITGVAGKDAGPGTPINVLAQVTEAFNTLTDLTIALETDDVVGFTGEGSVKTTLQSVNLVLAKLTLGKQISLSTLPKGCKRYIRLSYTVNGSNPSTGKIFAGLVDAVQSNNIA